MLDTITACTAAALLLCILAHQTWSRLQRCQRASHPTVSLPHPSSGKTPCSHDFDAEELKELQKKEKDMNVQPDWEIDAFTKAQIRTGKRHSIVTDLILKLLGLDVSCTCHHCSRVQHLHSMYKLQCMLTYRAYLWQCLQCQTCVLPELLHVHVSYHYHIHVQQIGNYCYSFLHDQAPVSGRCVLPIIQLASCFTDGQGALGICQGLKETLLCMCRSVLTH